MTNRPLRQIYMRKSRTEILFLIISVAAYKVHKHTSLRTCTHTEKQGRTAIFPSFRSVFFCGQFLIHPHEGRHAVGLRHLPPVEPVSGHDRLVILLMGFPEFRGHGQLVVQVREARLGVHSAGVKDLLSCPFDPFLLGLCWGFVGDGHGKLLYTTVLE